MFEGISKLSVCALVTAFCLMICPGASFGAESGGGEVPVPYMTKNTKDGEIQVPFCLSGAITAAPEIDFCADGATHLIYTFDYQGSHRLIGGNKQARKALEMYTDAKVVVVVCGYRAKSPECSLLNVFYADLAPAFVEKLK